jgi:PAS domain S-box-containing protein
MRNFNQDASRPQTPWFGAMEISAGTVASALCLAGLSAGVVFLSHQFTQDAGRVASIWPLNALLLAIILRWPGASPAVVIAIGAASNVAVDLAMGDTVFNGLALTLANVVEMAVCIYFLRPKGATFDISRPHSLLRFVFIAGGIAPAASAAIAACVLTTKATFLETLGVWFAADALGMLIFTPALLVVGSTRAEGVFPRRSFTEWGLGVAILVTVLFAVFGQRSYPLLFLVYPVVILATFRGGLTATAMSILVTACVAIWASVVGYGPTQLIPGSETDRVLVLQGFLAVMTLTSLPVAMALAERARASASLRAAREEAERAGVEARASENRYRALADYSTDIVVRLGKGGIISYASPACGILGITPEQAVGRSTIDFAAPEDRAFAIKTLEDLFSGAEPDRSIRREFRVPRTDGAVLWLEGNPSIIRDADGAPVEVVTTYRDVTTRRQLEDELRDANLAAHTATEAPRASEHRFRAIAETSRDMVARMDMNGVIRFVSPSCETVMGFSQEEMLGTTTMAHTHREDLEDVEGFFAKLISDGPNAPPRPYTFRARRKDGRIIWLEGIPKILFDEAGRPSEIQDSARDVTARKELEQALAEARVAAEAAAEAKAEFLANMSHELRTPLNSIIGFTQLLAGSAALPQAERRHVDLVAMSRRSLLTVVNDILDFSTLDEGRIRLEQRPFSVGETICRCVDSLTLQADAKNLRLETRLDETLAPYLVGDDTRLTQILLNLIGNAVKFTDQGSVAISVHTLPSVRDYQAFRITVRDTGIGIPRDRLDQLFVRFSQIDSSINRRFGGSGLGLAITKGLVDLMKGQIGVESLLGEGTTFWVELNLPIARSTEIPRPLGDAPPAVVAPGKKLRVLVVDDVDLNRELAAAFLATSGHLVDLASDGQEATALVQTQHYDIVFMDVQMPRMDGLTATRLIRAIPNRSNLPIVAMTAQALPDQIAACREAGMDDYLPKPITAESLPVMITKWAQARTDAKSDASGQLDVMASLRSRFLLRSRDDLQRMNELVASEEGVVSQELFALVHRFAGTAGTFGYVEAGQAAQVIESAISAGRAPDSQSFEPLLRAVESMVRAA